MSDITEEWLLSVGFKRVNIKDNVKFSYCTDDGFSYMLGRICIYINEGGYRMFVFGYYTKPFPSKEEIIKINPVINGFSIQ